MVLVSYEFIINCLLKNYLYLCPNIKKIFLTLTFIILNLKDFLLTCLFISTEKSISISMYSGFIYTQADFRNIQYKSMYYYDLNIIHGIGTITKQVY